MSDWVKTDKWYKRGKTFTIEISRHDRQSTFENDGKNCWCLYVIMSERHPLVKKMTKFYFKNKTIQHFPFHGGCTFAEKTGKAWKVGCDYSHYMDERFHWFSTLEDAYEVVRDAEELFEYFQNREDTP